ncbi:hypothetical protein ABZS81_18035 [Streptomyces sp. NPDC005318]|uniref:hypothetical protein n=1 Tax=Streptomyces sp. NPDC005318 TaxID=3157031 RepID=UPI0033ADC8B0
MDLVKRAFFAVDRAFGGDKPPTEGRMRAVRHPVRFGLGGAVFFGGLAALAIGRVDLPIVLYTVGAGVVVGLAVILERKRMEHYGFRLEEPTDGRERGGGAPDMP